MRVDAAATDPAVVAAWQCLAAAPATSRLFLSPSYLGALAGSIDRVSARRLALAWDGPQLVGALPLNYARCWRGLALSARFDIHPADGAFVRRPARYRFVPVRQLSSRIRLHALDLRGGFVAAADAQPTAVLTCLLGALKADASWDVAFFSCPAAAAEMWREAAAHAGVEMVLRSQNRRFHRSTTIDFGTITARHSRNFRRSMSRAEQRAATLGLTINTHVDEKAVTCGLAALRRVAAASWKANRADGVDVFCPWGDAQESLFRALAATDDIRPAVFTLSDTTERAVLSAFLYRDELVGGWLYYDPAVAEISPMRLLLRASFAWGSDNGATAYDFNATDPWIEPYADTSDAFLQIVVFAPHLRGRAIAALARRAGAWEQPG